MFPPRSHETVRARLAEFSAAEHLVLSSAAILGASSTGACSLAQLTSLPMLLSQALESGVQRQLLCVEGDGFAFRHALHPTKRSSSGCSTTACAPSPHALKALDASHPRLDDPLRDVATNLALQAGDNSGRRVVGHIGPVSAGSRRACHCDRRATNGKRAEAS